MRRVERATPSSRTWRPGAVGGDIGAQRNGPFTQHLTVPSNVIMNDGVQRASVREANLSLAMARDGQLALHLSDVRIAGTHGDRWQHRELDVTKVEATGSLRSVEIGLAVVEVTSVAFTGSHRRSPKSRSLLRGRGGAPDR